MANKKASILAQKNSKNQLLSSLIPVWHYRLPYKKQ